MFMRMIYDEKLAQAAYLIGCQRTGEAIVIDPQRDVDRYINLADGNDLRVIATAETHIHADFLSGSRELAESVNATVYVSDEGGPDWTYQWLDKRRGGGSYEHVLLHDGDVFTIGMIEFKVMHTPGHTPEHIAFMITDRGSGASEPMAMATGDFVFVGDLGRPDLLESAAGQAGAMEPSARQLYKTVGRLSNVPDFVQVWPAHGSGSACGKALGAVPTSTIGYERRFNPAIQAADNEQHFVDFILTGQPEPPLYFARMKRDNKIGPAVLSGVPFPPRMTIDELRAVDARTSAIIDTRPWDAFRTGHIRNALSIPLNLFFNTDAGSLVAEDEDIYLIIESSLVEEAVRDLIRIGLDNMKGWLDANEMELYDSSDAPLVSLPEVGIEEADTLLREARVRVLDVRRAAEFAEGHMPNAINVAHTRLASRLGEVPKDKHWLVNCRTGQRSACASAYLQRMGYEVANVKGGILAWEQLHATSKH